MNTFQYIKNIFASALVFIFLYTFNQNFELTSKFNIINFLIIIVVFVLWLLYGYFFIIKDIIKASERERNGLVLLMVLLAIIFFYYNPFPKPEGSFIDLPRYYYFILTTLIASGSFIMAWKKQYFGFIIAIMLPITIQSFLLNILTITTFSNFTYWIIMILVAVVYFINVKKQKK